MKTSQETFDELQRVEELIKNEHDYYRKQSLRDNEWREAIRNLIPREGLPCTEIYYTDRRAATVVKVVSPRTVDVMNNKVKCIDYYAGKYEVLPELEGGTHRYTKRKNGRWVLEGQPTNDGVVLTLHFQTHFIDPSY